MARLHPSSTAGDQRGYALLRYLLVFVLVAAVVVAAFVRFGVVVSRMFKDIADAVDAAV